MSKIIIKLGGSLITQKTRKDFPTNINEIKKRANEFIRYNVLKQLAKEISSLKDVELIVINGAGPFGHFLVNKKTDPRTIHSSVELLNQKIIDIFKQENKDLVAVHPCETCLFEENFQTDKLWNKTKQILQNNKIPITYGDVILTEKGYKVISGDDLATDLAKRWKADKIIMVTDVEGVYTKNPEIYSDARLILKLKEMRDIQFETNNIDITGGLQSKVKKLLGVDIPSQIINGSEPGNIKKAIKGESIGTIVG